MHLLGLYFMVDGKCHYAHQDEEMVNEHLITGLMSALATFYREIYHNRLQFIQLNDISIKLTPIDDFEIVMIYRGDEDEAEMYLCRILEEFCINQMVDTTIDRIDREQEQIFMQLVTEIAGETAVSV